VKQRKETVGDAARGRLLFDVPDSAAAGLRSVAAAVVFVIAAMLLLTLTPRLVSAAEALPGLVGLSDTVQASTSTPFRGEAVILVMGADDAGIPLAVEFLGHRRLVAAINGDRSSTGRYVTVCPVSLSADPGLQVLKVVREHGSERLSLEVQPADYGEEHLRLPPEMVTPSRPEHLERIRRDRRRLAAAYGSSADRILFTMPFIRPLDGDLITPFGKRRILNGIPKQPHGGIDIRAATGAPVHASAAGRVVLAEDLYYSGRAVIIDHGLDVFSLYLHLDEFVVSVGDEVGRGQLIGRVGSTGRVTGPHLHWGIKIAGVFVDPLRFVAASRFLTGNDSNE
jgi:murein DD-endopeptidase MepM/ murein hydrolase activator NlpD